MGRRLGFVTALRGPSTPRRMGRNVIRRLIALVGVPLASCAIAAAAFPASAGATQSTSTNPANAPQGTHYKSGTATCSVNSNTGSVTCSRYTLAGVGNTNVTANLSATYSA